jgi:hypothetical protein
MPTKNGRQSLSLLDTVIIIILAFTADLLLLWIASQIRGLSLFERLPEWLTALSKSVWSWVTGAAGSIVLAFLRRRLNATRESPNYLLWSGGTAVIILLALTLVVHVVFPVDGAVQQNAAGNTNRVEGSEFDLLFRLREPAAKHPTFAVTQSQPQTRARRNTALQDDSYYHVKGDLPAPCRPFEAAAYVITEDSELLNNPRSSPMSLMFFRSPKDPAKAPREVVEECNLEDMRCRLSLYDHGWASDGKDCKPSSRTWLPGFVNLAYSQEQSKGNVQPGWRVPSLETLSEMKDREKVGYTKFLIKSGLPQSLKQADSFRYSIRVNGTPLYIDGSRPEDMIEPLQPSAGLDFAFGLENLNFSGADRGCENISVLFEFQKQSQVIQSAEVSRRYAALRDAEPEEVQSKDGSKFSWSGQYVKPQKEDKFEVFIRSTPDVNEATSIKTRLDGAKLQFQGKEVVGVLRPPLNQDTYGVAAGLLQSTGQIRFTFDRKTGSDLLKWTQEVGRRPGMSGIIHQQVFLYQMRPGDSGSGKYRPCSGLRPG